MVCHSLSCNCLEELIDEEHVKLLGTSRPDVVINYVFLSHILYIPHYILDFPVKTFMFTSSSN
jgi:hypothetical protein